jgi:lysophospholipase L1-like esterase
MLDAKDKKDILTQRFKQIAFSALTVFICLLILEVGVRVIFFQYEGNRTFALQSTLEKLRKRRQALVLEHKKTDLLKFKESIRGAGDALYSPEGKKLLNQFTQEYESKFSELVSASRRISSRLVVLYLPSRTTDFPPGAYCRAYYKNLANRYGVDFLDLTDKLYAHSINEITLMPVNGHLSRFGNQIIARKLLEYIKTHPNSSNIVYSGTPTKCGDLKPNSRKIWDIVETMPYFVVVNNQGFRMSEDLDVPKTRIRVLCLGDSFTFGPYLPNHDTYPELLGAMDTSLEVINAGICGYTITDEVSLFVESAQYVAPDITVLQVLDNDIYGLFYFKKNEFDRKRMKYEPSRLEKEFIDRIVARNEHSKEEFKEKGATLTP